MSAVGGFGAAGGRRAFRLPGWAPAILLLVGTALVGPMLGGSARMLFVAGCAAAGWYAWRQGPRAHLQAALFLFAFAPFVRRLVDAAVGYDDAGLMLVGPLLALLAPALDLHRLTERGAALPSGFGPFVVVGLAVAYAAMLALLDGGVMDAASGTVKWAAPIVYAAALLQSGRGTDLVEGAASAFAVILPILGLYGIFQYVDPPAWDRYWMSFAPILSAGRPLPYEVRVFATMNGPASFASFVAVGLLLVAFLRPGWQALLTAPAALALLLSTYRTAWLSLAAGVLFCLLFAATRRRATAALAGIVLALAVAATLTPFGEVIENRLATLGQGTEDDSAQERLDQYATLWTLPDSSLFGVGFTVSDVGSAGSMAVDGMIIACWLLMGIPVGLACLAGLVWAAVRAVAAAARSGAPALVVLGGLAVGSLVQLPLASIASGELGFLFWTFATLAIAAPVCSAPLGSARDPGPAGARR